MKKENAKEVCDKFWKEESSGKEHRHANVDAFDFLDWLYKEGYIILSPEEVKKVNAMTVLAEVHGMNPFKPKK